MKTIVLVGCGKSKLTRKAPAKDLYTGLLFRKARAWAEKHGDEWAILSAKHFLVMPDQIVAPYERRVQDLNRDYLKQWIWNTNWFIRARWPQETTRFICLASKAYGQAFEHPVKLKVEFPLEGMGIGKRIQWLGLGFRLSRGSDGARSDARNAESVPGVAPVAPMTQPQSDVQVAS